MDHARPIAFLALALVLPVTIAAFSMMRPTRAALLVLFGSLLFLPERVNFDAPLIPPMDKETIPQVCIMIAVLTTARDRLRQARPGRGADLLMLLGIPMNVGMILTNHDALQFGPVILPGHPLGDILSDFLNILMHWYMPFLIGRALFRTAADAKDLLVAIVIAGAVYLPFILVELRLSPQWHNWIYGFGQHDFTETIRGGGYRPMCFMPNGLALALFMWASLFSAWTLASLRVAILGVPAIIYAWIFSVLFPFLKSMAALVYAVVSVPVGRWLSPIAQMRIAALIGLIVFTYPVARATELFPANAIVDLAAQVSQERAGSLDFRFRNENDLIRRALSRPWFGWGGFSRSHVYTSWGQDISTSDGHWIIILGTRGIVGYTIYFGTLLIPLITSRRYLRQMAPNNQRLVAGTALLLAFYAIDLLPNGAFNQLPLLLSGAVMGLSRGMAEESTRGSRSTLLQRLRSLMQQDVFKSRRRTLETPREIV